MPQERMRCYTKLDVKSKTAYTRKPTLTDMPSAKYRTSFHQDRLTYAGLYVVVAVLTKMLQQISTAMQHTIHEFNCN